MPRPRHAGVDENGEEANPDKLPLDEDGRIVPLFLT